MRRSYATTLVLGFLSTGPAAVQAQMPDNPPAGHDRAATATPAPPPSPLRRWGTEFSFLFDGYVDKNLNDPPTGFNALRNYDVRANMPHVSLGMIAIDHLPAPIGFQLDVGFGETFDIIHAGNRDPGVWKSFKQAYVSIKPESWRGVELDAGEFVSPAGAEVIETNQDFNYSRSLLFAWAVPATHTGFRLQYPVGSRFTGSVQVVNGWNNVEPINRGKTYGFTGAYAWKTVAWSNNYYAGPEHPGTTKGWRNLYDSSVVVNPNGNLSYYVNFDYARDKNIGPGAGSWVGLAAAIRRAVGKRTAVAARLEFFDDRNGLATGLAQTVKECTLTGEYKLTGWLLTRAEFRTDWSNRPFFGKKDQPNGATTQPTLLLGLIAFLAPKK